jgi:hypothetical protein
MRGRAILPMLTELLTPFIIKTTFMSAEIKSGKVKIEFSLSQSLKKRIRARVNKQKKSFAQYFRDLAQADLKKK